MMSFMSYDTDMFTLDDRATGYTPGSFRCAKIPLIRNCHRFTRQEFEKTYQCREISKLFIPN